MFRFRVALSISKRAMVSTAPGLSGSVSPSPLDPVMPTHLYRTRIASAGPLFASKTWITGRDSSWILLGSVHKIGVKESSRTERSLRLARAIDFHAAVAAIAVKTTVPTVASALTAALFSFSHRIASSHQLITRLYKEETR